jgi:hypothetical protein
MFMHFNHYKELVFNGSCFSFYKELVFTEQRGFINVGFAFFVPIIEETRGDRGGNS